MEERVQAAKSLPVNLSLHTDSHSTEMKRDLYSMLPTEGGVVATVKAEYAVSAPNLQQDGQSYNRSPFQQSAHEARPITQSRYMKDEQKSMPDSTFEDSYTAENVVRAYVCLMVNWSICLFTTCYFRKFEIHMDRVRQQKWIKHEWIKK